VLWLLHGCCDSYQSWTRSTDVDELAELADVLVVMPEAGEVGFYTDWCNGGRKGPPWWETFHLTELRQLLERDWRAGDRRVIAGLSMGGSGQWPTRRATRACSGRLPPTAGCCTPAIRVAPYRARR
jgi:diacylglycerol O-acyltransferase / trehalose O-mycolyltransferase / mycolyltransferase Ag85